MRTNEKKYKDYGFVEGEAKQLKLYCRSPDFTKDEERILWQAAEMSNPALKELLFKSVRYNTGYYKLRDESYIPLPARDFYGYQRLCLYHLKRMMQK